MIGTRRWGAGPPPPPRWACETALSRTVREGGAGDAGRAFEADDATALCLGFPTCILGFYF